MKWSHYLKKFIQKTMREGTLRRPNRLALFCVLLTSKMHICIMQDEVHSGLFNEYFYSSIHLGAKNAKKSYVKQHLLYVYP